MSIQIVNHSYKNTQYNLQAHHPLQSWQWGEAKKRMGTKILRLAEFEKKRLKSVFQMTLHRIPYTQYQLGYIPRSVIPSKEILRFLYQYGKSHHLIFIKFEPYITKPTKTKNIFQINHNLQIARSKHFLFPQWTQILNLEKSEENLLKRMRPKTRYNLRLAKRKGVVVREMSDEEGFKIFSDLYFKTCKRQKYFGHNPRYHRLVWRNLKKNIAHILIAFYKNEPLAVYELFYFKKILYYVYGGSSMLHRNLMGANLLMWEAIKLGKKLGAKKFDMWGSLAPNYNKKHPWAGFTRFKEGYGTEFVETVGSYDLIINPWFYKAYGILYSLRNSYLQMKARI